jgi:hypothetical protein
LEHSWDDTWMCFTVRVDRDAPPSCEKGSLNIYEGAAPLTIQQPEDER